MNHAAKLQRMGRLQFLRDKKFYIHLAIIILLFFVLLWITFRTLRSYTRHDEVYVMPDLVGQDLKEVQSSYADNFNFIVIDSVYPKGQTPGSIFQQDPFPGSKVKNGRNVYCIIVAQTPEKTLMPNLNNLSLRQALVLLESSGLRVKELVYVDYFARNAICKQLFKGKVVEPGTELIKGENITLEVGIGSDKKKMKTPNLIGTYAADAQRLLNLAGLNIGNETFEDQDSIQYMRIAHMQPGPNSPSVAPGTAVSVWYRSERKLNFKKEMSHLLTQDSIDNAILFSDSINDTIMATEEIETTDYEYEDEF